MEIKLNPASTKIPTRLEVLESMSYTIILNGAELSALAQLTRMIGGLPNTTYRKYTQPLTDWYERQEVLFNNDCDRWFFLCDGVINTYNIPE